MQQQKEKEKKRIYTIARELGVDIKDVLLYCKELGFEGVKNQLSSLDPEQCDRLKERIKRGSQSPSVAPITAPRPELLNKSLDELTKVRTISTRKKPERGGAVTPVTPASPHEEAESEVEIVTESDVAPTEASETAPVDAPVEPTVEAPPVAPVVVEKSASPPEPPPPPPPEVTPVTTVKPTPPPSPPVSPPIDTGVAPGSVPTSPSVKPAPAPTTTRPSVSPLRSPLPTDMGRIRDLRAPIRRPAPPPAGTPASPTPAAAAGSTPSAPAPASPAARPGASPPPSPPSSASPGVRRALRPGIRPVPGGAPTAKPMPTPSLREKLRLTNESKAAPTENVIAPKKRLTEEEMKRIRTTEKKEEVRRIISVTPKPTVAPIDDDEDEDKPGRRVGEGGIPGRADRHARRKERAEQRKTRMSVTITTDGQVEVTDEEERIRRRKLHARTKQRQPGTVPRAGKVPIDEPITVRALSEAIGWKVGKLLFQLMELGAPKNLSINSVIDTDLAEAVALEANVELEVRRAQSAEDRLMAAHAETDAEESLVPRAPVVTIMGHVDHGKTTLLDYIRHSNVVDTEAGGITQVIRAWRVEHNGQPITFIDTPGHEAFTKMRARGAQVTDIAVIVVAATDGVMPQTEEAINHARASGVPLVVCITKTDMPNANVTRTRNQLYALNILPDTQGGDTPFVETALVKEKDSDKWKIARGVDELLEQILVVAELRELKANPNKAASGTCLEASKIGEEGVSATLLVQQGTLHRGDVVLCGGSYGRVRAMYDDLGRPIESAGPSVPVRITGLDEVPDAGDSFHVVPELSVAREIAEKRREKKQEGSLAKTAAMTLESLAQKKVAELKIILKADFRGSIEAIRAELEKLKHEEVRVRLLHTGIGAITESDVQLALTSPEDTIIVGFNAVPDDTARALAEARGIQIREYNIIYNLKDDIKKALEGRLKPREEVIHLGRAVVRETFKISKVGTVAGCRVTQGVIERSAKVRVIREGVVVYPPADKTASLESLKRFKEDANEVREGFECGLKIAGYDDVKVGDVIEAYRIEQVKRTL